MQLTITQAAALLNKSPRQLRHMLKTGKVTATKVDGRWVFDDKALPLDEHQKQVRAVQVAELIENVDRVMAKIAPAEVAKSYSVWDLQVFRLLAAEIEPCRRQWSDSLQLSALQRAIVALAQGCHRFRDTEKISAFREGRDFVAEAIGLLYCEPDPLAKEMAGRLEQKVLPGMSGLIRKYELKRK